MDLVQTNLLVYFCQTLETSTVNFFSFCEKGIAMASVLQCKTQQPETSLYVQPLEDEGSHDAGY